MAVNPADVAALLNPNSDPVSESVAAVTAMARAYTRGRGFDADGQPNDEVAAAITTAAARLAANGSQLSHSTNAGGQLVLDVRGGVAGWTAAELATLNRYRVRAM